MHTTMDLHHGMGMLKIFLQYLRKRDGHEIMRI
jgi:hypothetical protein